MNYQVYGQSIKAPASFKKQDKEAAAFLKQIFQTISKPKHKIQTSYSNYNRESKVVFVNQNELADTLQIQHQKTLSESSSHISTISHGISFGSKGQQGFPPDFTLSTNFRSTKGNIVAQLTSNRLYFSTLRMKLNNANTVEATYQSQANPMNPDEFHTTLKATHEYKGYDYRITTKADLIKGAFSAAYMQQLNDVLSAGVQAQYNIEARKSTLSYAVRYFMENADSKGTGRLFAIETKMEDGAANGAMINQDYTLKATYHDDVAYNVRMCGEFLYNFAEREAKFKYGFMQSFFDGKFKACVNHDWEIQAVLEHKLTPQAQIAFSAEANPAKADFKFGATVQYSSH